MANEDGNSQPASDERLASIEGKISSIEEKIGQFLPEVEGVIAHRVYDAAKSRLIALAKVAGVAGAVLLSIVGYQGYGQIVETGTDRVAEIFAKQGLPQITDFARHEVNVLLAKEMANVRAEASAKFDQQLADMTAIYQKRFDVLLAQLDTDLPEPQMLEGYALYGEGTRAESGEWVWNVRNFQFRGVPREKFPEPSDKAATVKAVVVKNQPPIQQFDVRKYLPIQQQASPKIKVNPAFGSNFAWAEMGDLQYKFAVLEDRDSSPIGTLLEKSEVEIGKVDILLDRYVWVQVKQL